MKINQFYKSKNFDYLIIVIRFLLAIIFISYGYGKLTEEQFGLTIEELQKPIKELNLLQIGWYLFDQQPFKFFIGVSQIICGILLLINRTVLIGAVLFLPIVINILIIDLTIMPKAMANAFAIRLIFYIFLDSLIFLHYKKQTTAAIQKLLTNVKPKFKHNYWTILLIPVFAVCLEILPIVPKILWQIIQDPATLYNYMVEIYHNKKLVLKRNSG